MNVHKRKNLYKFKWDCDRNGEIDGLFLATEEEVKNAIGKEVFFGDVLGKYSEIYGTLEEGDLKVTRIPYSIEVFLLKEFGKTLCGYNPLDYISENE